MRNNSNTIRFVAFVVVLLLGTINTWAYRVRFDVNGGSACADMYTNAAGEITLPTSTRSGMYLTGWYDGNLNNSNLIGYAGEKYIPTSDVTLHADWANEVGTQTIGSQKKMVDVNKVFSYSYEIPNNTQREFTFTNSRRKGLTERYFNWVMWAANSYRTNWDNRKDYFYMNLAPCVRKHLTANDDFWGNYEETSVFIKQDNGELTSLETAEQWNLFLKDMENASVNVKVSNYNGKIRVYSVMKYGNVRTYVYPYEYEKYAINNRVNGSVWVYFSVDHTQLTNFTANDAVGLAVVNCNLDYTTPYGPRNCSFSIATPEGLGLPVGTMVGENDKLVYTINLGNKWSLTRWGEATNDNDNPRTVTVTNANVKSGWVAPYATLVYSGLNLENGRIFHLDFEGMTDNDLIPVVEYPDGSMNAPTEHPTADEQGKFYNYGRKGRIMSDPVFGKYYQNLAVNPSEYTASKAENFLRYILTDEQQDDLNKINDAEGAKAATIGFWVNGRVAVDYELPLERGSMFCIFTNERFRKADAGNIEAGQEPRFMFDISCNGWIYSYIPNTYYETDGSGHEVKMEYVNKFFYGETYNLVDDPKPSLFGVNNYAHTQNQCMHKFYDDKRWHYVTYVATEDLKKVTMYLDGVKAGELDTRTLGNMQFFDEDGDYPGRVHYLRNLVLGGFTPHGLFFEKQYYSDAALAYDDISIYSRALTESEIRDIITEKGYEPNEWHFTEAVKAGIALDSYWQPQGNSVYKLKKNLNKENLTSNNQTILFSTEGLKFTATDGSIFLDTKHGCIGLTRGAGIFIPNVGKSENLYFVAKPQDQVNYPLDHYDLYPYSGALGDFNTRGVSFYGGEGKEDFSMLVAYKHTDLNLCGFQLYKHHNTDENGNDHNTGSNNNILWLSDIFISPYCMVYTNNAGNLFGVQDRKSVHYVDVKITGTTIPATTFPKLILTKDAGSQVNLSDYKQGNTKGNPYIRYSSSAPRVAYVDQNGNVTLTGLAGYATIKAELIFGNIHDGVISTAYTIRVTEEAKTFVAQNEGDASTSVYGVGNQFTVKANDGTDAITMTMGGWAYTESYAGSEGDDMVDGKNVDGWSRGFDYLDNGDIESIDGIVTASEGAQNAKSESYLKEDENGEIVSDGCYVPVAKSDKNNTPWTLPARGAYFKLEPSKAGVISIYVLQNGNLHKSNTAQDYSDMVKWRPVYVTDESGAVVKGVRAVTNSRISENDNFFKEGRRRAQFIEDVEGTYNQRLKDALLELKSENIDRFHLLINNWENAGWKQKVIETGDGGYMVMSKGIVRYTFNVYPGKTYYVFSNHTKLGYSGYHFEEGKFINNDNFESNPVRDATEGSAVVFEDKMNGGSYTQPSFPVGADQTPVTYNREFKADTWSSICLPFSMSSKQVSEAFGEGTAMVLLKNIRDNGKIELIWHVNQDIIAGYPYFILPKKTITGFTDVNVHFECASPLFAVSSDGNTYEPNGNYDYKPGYPYVFEGNFVTTTVPAGSYVMSNSGALSKLKKNVEAKPFRAYIRCLNAAQAKPLTTMDVNDSEGETTTIEELLQDNGIILESSDVYGVNGLKVRSNTHSLEGLSKGVYVVNGKKYVVK
ncbi:MAG: InlB B-repeat-containing protein [Prevotella sp.]|nr:InlB B-repeat-containing protein [Prevotella sp.]